MCDGTITYWMIKVHVLSFIGCCNIKLLYHAMPIYLLEQVHVFLRKFDYNTYGISY